jgi:hypothetical protein
MKVGAVKQMHENMLMLMKNMLDLGELAFSGVGGNSSGAFRNYKSQMMLYVTRKEQADMDVLSREGVVEICPCGASLDGGPRWDKCPDCAGSGYRMKGEH